MRFFKLAALGLAALASIGAGPRVDWNTVINRAPSGAHIRGNPAAPVKLAEYASYTCSHCAHFEMEADAPMRLEFIRTGKVSFELRHLLRDPVDLTAAMMTNCGPPARFFGNHAAILRAQSRWLGTLQSASEAQRTRWTSGDPAARRRAIASDFGFYTILQARGYGRVELDRCLADNAMVTRLIAQTEAGQQLGVTGTPSFVINGELLDIHDWASLRAELRARQ